MGTNRVRVLVALAGAAAAVAAFTAAPAGAAPSRAGVVFVQTDDPAGNHVVVYDRSAAGTLTKAGQYATGGVGGKLDGSVVDHLASQGSVAYDAARHALYVTNAGSDSITVFGVNGDRLTRRGTAWSGGSFPVSIAIHGDRLFVLDARDGGRIQGYLRIGAALVRIPAWQHGLGLDGTLTPEFTSTPGQVAFSPDGSRLLVTTKGNTSSIEVFRAGYGRLGAPVVTALPGAVPFALTFRSSDRVVLAEAGTNAVATLRLRTDGHLDVLHTAATNAAATCWIVASADHVWVSNAGSGTLSGYRVSAGGSLTGTGSTATDGGTVDAVVTRHFLYVQTGAAGIVDEFRIGSGGALTRIGSVTVPNGVGAEGIAAS
jgi:DNA-binding beta-propeller fold protein YncE